MMQSNAAPMPNSVIKCVESVNIRLVSFNVGYSNNNQAYVMEYLNYNE
jgi:hypothetical protein